MSTVEEALNNQRKNIHFNVQNLSKFIYGEQWYLNKKKSFPHFIDVPYDFNIFNLSRIELLKESYRIIPSIINFQKLQNQHYGLYLLFACMQQIPYTLHFSMFTYLINFLGTDQLKEKYLEKCKRYEMIGTYAQTELGHGSDVQSLETTAIYDEEKEIFIINTPSVSAYKYWPGDLGFNANHVAVFAKMIIKGQNYGIQPFLVRIKDQDQKLLPNIQIGDIGPKIGYNAKDNGYLALNNVIIPKQNLINRFVKVGKNGDISLQGDPKIGYASMMLVRCHMCYFYPRMYMQPIIYAVRYSLFRRQFKNSANKQIQIIDYQLQQQKLIPRVAEMYALIVTGRKINDLAQENFKKVLQKNDSSLMAQTHNCLCAGKTFFSELVLNGIQICRKSCGGHGYSHYSGFPSIYFQYLPNVTAEGQSSILYLQIAKYILKSYQSYKKQGIPLQNSVRYLQSLDYLLQKKIQISKKITLQSLRILFEQAVCIQAIIIQKKQSQNSTKSPRQVIDQQTGINRQKMAILHCCLFTFQTFRNEILSEKSEQIRELLFSLCQLFGINLILTFTSSFIQGELITPTGITTLKDVKQELLAFLRPKIVGLIDAFQVQQRLIRSLLAKGNPYKNYLQEARKCQLNSKIQPSAIYVKDNIQQALRARL